VCKSFKVCDTSSSWGVADAFDMLQPLLSSLHISPANKFVEVSASNSRYVSDSCSCRSPVEVKVKIPVFQSSMVDTISTLVEDYMEKSVAPGLKALPQAGCWAETSAEFASKTPMCVKPKGAAAPQGSICKKLTFCQDEANLEAAKEQVTASLQPLFDLINLPAGRFLEFEPLSLSCLSQGCCCSTPLEVTLRVPVLEDTAVEDVTELVDSWVSENLRDPAESNSICVKTRAVSNFVEGNTCKPRVSAFATVKSAGGVGKFCPVAHLRCLRSNSLVQLQQGALRFRTRSASPQAARNAHSLLSLHTEPMYIVHCETHTCTSAAL
jgi:hypothetical protein